MAALTRNPLSTRLSTNQGSTFSSLWQSMPRKPTTVKRARSPDPGDHSSAKRSKALADTSRSTVFVREDAKRKETKDPKEERERKRAEREEEFRIKYTRAFPNWVFYFDVETDDSETALARKELERMVLHMNARVEDFFSKDVTHLIVMEFDETLVNKENMKSKASQSSTLLSPIKLKAPPVGDTPASELVQKALAFEMKIWTVEKLRSVLDRCVSYAPIPSISNNVALRTNHTTKERILTRLLESERLHGTTERDPTQKRHDHTYFSKNSYFVLVEDLRQELATVVALEYPISKSRDGKEKGPWPVLYCHPLARGPFVEYDEKEERRRTKAEEAEKEREEVIERRKAKLLEQEKRRRAQQAAKRKGDLRRTVSMYNMRRRLSIDGDACPEGYVDLDAGFEDEADSAAPSGYLASGAYVAASGNSVGITSATGTTSTAGLSRRSLQLPVSLRDKLQQQIVTSRKPSQTVTTMEKDIMGPPLTIPDRPHRLLKKSRSTNTMRLPKRDEGIKPGYCESCRMKFEDFKEHVYSKKHRKFAEDDDNFASLDSVLSRVRRRTVEEVRGERESWEQTVDDSDEEDDGGDMDGDADQTMAFHFDDEEDIQWDEWVDTDSP